MTNLKRICLALAVCVLIVPGIAKDKKPVESRPLAAPIQVDANPAEWPAESLTLEKDPSVGYAFQNDAANLFILFQFNDAKAMSSVEATGLTLWVNNDGKEKKNYGLHFGRKTVAAADLIKLLEAEGQSLTDDKKKEFLSRPSYQIWACDTINKKGEPIPHTGIPGGTFRSAKTAKGAIYELVVPMALLKDPGAEKAWDPSLPVKLDFEWGGLTEDMKRAQAGNLGDQGSRASAGAADLGSQIGGGEGGDFNAPSSSLAGMRQISAKYKKMDFWIDLKVYQAK